MGESELGLSAGAQASPSSAELLAASAELGGQEAQGSAGHVDAGRVDKHTKPLVETDFLVENPSPRAFTCLSAQLPSRAVRLESAHSKGSQRINMLLPAMRLVVVVRASLTRFAINLL
nr:hypothetical protein StreXyl84_73390 [Streptomyces sp. Xyl84]